MLGTHGTHTRSGPPTTLPPTTLGAQAALAPKPISVVFVNGNDGIPPPFPRHIIGLKHFVEVQPLPLAQAWGGGHSPASCTSEDGDTCLPG